MKDIALDLGVSVVTVSKAIRNHEDISAHTRARVMQRIKELDYRPNLAARALATGKSYLMGLVVPDLIHPFFCLIARGASRVLRTRGYSLIVSSSEEESELENQELNLMLARGLDVFMVASAQSDSEILKRFEWQKPLILIDRRFKGFPAHYVGTDDREVGRIATAHLIERGCRRVACIGGKDVSTARDRLEGYKQALHTHGMPLLTQYVVDRQQGDYYSDVTGYQAMQALLHLETKPDAVFCLNYPTAMGAMKAIAEHGLRIPEDIAVIGCGNVPFASELRVPLSSIDQSSELIGEHAAKLALSLVESKRRTTSPKAVLMKPKLIARRSTDRSPAS